MQRRLCLLILAFWAFLLPDGIRTTRAVAAEGGHAVEHGKSEKSKNEEKGEDSDITGGRFSGDPIYVHIKPMVLPVIREDGVEQIVSLILDIHVKDSGTADYMHKNMPRVMDALLRNLYGEIGEGTPGKKKLVNVTKVKTCALRGLSEVVERDKIVDVLVQAVSQRML